MKKYFRVLTILLFSSSVWAGDIVFEDITKNAISFEGFKNIATMNSYKSPISVDDYYASILMSDNHLYIRFYKKKVSESSDSWKNIADFRSNQIVELNNPYGIQIGNCSYKGVDDYNIIAIAKYPKRDPEKNQYQAEDDGSYSYYEENVSVFRDGKQRSYFARYLTNIVYAWYIDYENKKIARIETKDIVCYDWASDYDGEY